MTDLFGMQVKHLGDGQLRPGWGYVCKPVCRADLLNHRPGWDDLGRDSERRGED